MFLFLFLAQMLFYPFIVQQLCVCACHLINLVIRLYEHIILVDKCNVSF